MRYEADLSPLLFREISVIRTYLLNIFRGQLDPMTLTSLVFEALKIF